MGSGFSVPFFALRTTQGRQDQRFRVAGFGILFRRSCRSSRFNRKRDPGFAEYIKKGNLMSNRHSTFDIFLRASRRDFILGN